MKIDRLIGILSILLQQDKVTAPYLAEKFEVSRRTISRDIEDLCMAGIPLVTTQGQNGGISIMEGYRMDKTLLTNSDMQSILIGLRGLDSIASTNKYQTLMDKLSVGESSTLPTNNHILIDLASWYRGTLTPKIELLQTAIDQKRIVSFHYYGPRGNGQREIEPYLLLFQWSSWYVWGYCLEKEDFRLFKLSRLQELEMTKKTYEGREVPPFETDTDKVFPKKLEAKIIFDQELEWLIMDEFGIDSYQKQADGTLLMQSNFYEKDSLFQFLLGLGEKAELLEPADLRREVAERIEKMNQKYKK